MKKVLSLLAFLIVILALTELAFAQNFSTADLTGTHHGYWFGSDLAGNPYFGYGTITIDGSGNLTAGFSQTSQGIVPFTGGTLSVDSTGKITGSISDGVGDVYTIRDAKINSSKDVLVFSTISSTGARQQGIFLRDGGTFSTSDLSGTHYGYWAGADFTGNPYVGYGTLSLNSGGNITGGSYTIDLGTLPFTSGLFSVDSSGRVTGSITDAQNDVYTIQDAKINLSKNIMIFLTTSTNGSIQIGILLREGGSFSTSDLSGTHNAYWVGVDPSSLPSLGYGTIILDTSGTVTGGSYDGSLGPGTFTGGAVSIDSQGIITGSVSDTTGQRIIQSAKMSSLKDISIFLTSSTNDSSQLGFFLRGESGSGGSGSATGSPSGSSGSSGSSGGGGCFISTMF